MNRINLIVTLFISTFSFSQNNLDHKVIGDTIYYKNFRFVSKDSATNFATLKNIETINNKKQYLLDFYNIKDIDNFYSIRTLSTHTQRLEIVAPIGNTTYYHKNGKKSSLGKMANGRAIGKWTYWYDNENKKMERLFFESKVLGKIKPNELVNYWDKSGKQTVINGYGSYNFTTEKDSTLHKGNVKNGKKDGIWIGRFKNGQKYYDENYKEGKLITGDSWDKKGNHFSYTEEFQQAQFKRGQKGIRKIIEKNFKVPEIAKQKKIDGTILVSFYIDVDGSVTEVVAFRKVLPESDAEAIRVVKLMKGWKPAIRRGKKIKTRFAIPITYIID